MLAQNQSPSAIEQAIARAAEVQVDIDSLDDARARDALINALVARGRPFTLVVDGLDQANDPEATALLLRTLAMQAALVGVRVLVATRPGRHHRLVTALGHAAVEFNLNDPQWLAVGDLADYVRQRLISHEDPTNPNPYPSQPELARQIAYSIAKRAYPNFLVAQLLSHPMAADALADIRTADQQSELPFTVADAMRSHLAAFRTDQDKVHELLTPLAYARGAGLPRDAIWPAMATSLTGHSYDIKDVDWLLVKAADLLVNHVNASGAVSYRLYHEALADYLRHGRTRDSDEQLITDALIATVPIRDDSGKDWLRAHQYVQIHLADHAAAAGRLDSFMAGLLEHRDPGFSSQRIMSVCWPCCQLSAVQQQGP